MDKPLKKQKLSSPTPIHPDETAFLKRLYSSKRPPGGVNRSFDVGPLQWRPSIWIVGAFRYRDVLMVLPSPLVTPPWIVFYHSPPIQTLLWLSEMEDKVPQILKTRLCTHFYPASSGY